MLESVWLPLAADTAVAGLLVVTLLYVVRLNNRLAALRADRGALADLIAGLQRASEQAENAVGGLRISANESGRALEHLLDRGAALRDDLSFLLGRAESVAERLEAAQRGRPEPAGVAAAEAARGPAPTPASGRLTSLLRQAAAAERGDSTLRMVEPRDVPASDPDAMNRKSRSERELQRVLLGRG